MLVSVSKAEMNIFYFLLCRYGHMIDNVVLIVTSTLHERDVQELLEKCHPLGMFYWVFAPKPLIRVIGFRNIFLLKSPVLVLEHSPLIIFLSFSFIALVFNIYEKKIVFILSDYYFAMLILPMTDLFFTATHMVMRNLLSVRTLIRYDLHLSCVICLVVALVDIWCFPSFNLYASWALLDCVS